MKKTLGDKLLRLTVAVFLANSVFCHSALGQDSIKDVRWQLVESVLNHVDWSATGSLIKGLLISKEVSNVDQLPVAFAYAMVLEGTKNDAGARERYHYILDFLTDRNNRLTLTTTTNPKIRNALIALSDTVTKDHSATTDDAKEIARLLHNSLNPGGSPDYTIDANNCIWQKTLLVDPGQSVSIRYRSGQWTWRKVDLSPKDKAAPMVGPEGYHKDAHVLLPDPAWGKLKARLGADIFLVELPETRRFNLDTQPQWLYLGMSIDHGPWDDDLDSHRQLYKDASGSLVVSISCDTPAK